MPGANLPELTQEITSIPRDAFEYPRCPMDDPGDTRLELKEVRSEAQTSNCNDVTCDAEKRSSLRKLVLRCVYVYQSLLLTDLYVACPNGLLI